MSYFNQQSPIDSASTQRQAKSARQLTIGLTFFLVFALLLEPLIDTAAEMSRPFVLPRIQAFIVLISFFLIGILSPAWSTSRRGFIAITSTLIATLGLIFAKSLHLDPTICFAIFALGWLCLTLSVQQHGFVFRLLLSYGLIICACFLIGSHFIAAQYPLYLIGYLLMLGAFPIAAWQPVMFSHLSAGVGASFVVLQQVMAQQVGVFFPVEHLTTTQFVFFGFATCSSLMALYQLKGQRALAALAASQSLFMAYCFLLPATELQEARLFIANAYAIATPGFILVLGLLESRVGQLSLARPSGNYAAYPRLANSILLFGLLSAAFPLTLGFVGVDLLIETLFHNNAMIVIGWLGVLALNAIFAMKCFLFLCLGRADDATSMDILPIKYLLVCGVIVLSFISAFALPLIKYLLH